MSLRAFSIVMEGRNDAVGFNKNRRNTFVNFGFWIFGWLSIAIFLGGCSDPVREFGSIVRDPEIKAALIERMKTYQLEGSVHDPAIRIFMGYCFELRLDGVDASAGVLGAADGMPGAETGNP